MDTTLYITVGLKLYEPCINNKQCSGTENPGNCTEIRHKTLCFCQDEYLDFNGRCIKGIFSFTNCHYFFRFKEKNNKDIYKHLQFFLLSSLKVKDIEVALTLKVKSLFQFEKHTYFSFLIKIVSLLKIHKIYFI